MVNDEHTTEPEGTAAQGDPSTIRTARLRRRQPPAEETLDGAPEPLGFSLETEAGGLVLVLTGGLDQDTAQDLRAAIEEIKAAPPRRLTIDLSNLRLLDAKGAAMLAALVKAVIAEGGKSRIIGAVGQPASKLSRLAFERFVPVTRG